MTSLELRRIISKLNLTQTAFSHLIGVDPRTMRYWLGDTRPIPTPVKHLINLASNGRPAMDYLEAIYKKGGSPHGISRS